MIGPLGGPEIWQVYSRPWIWLHSPGCPNAHPTGLVGRFERWRAWGASARVFNAGAPVRIVRVCWLCHWVYGRRN